MRHALISLVALLAVSLPAFPAAQSKSPAIVGTWSGPYEGDSTGTYSMTITQGESKALGGTLEATSADGGSFTANFKSVVTSGATATLKYDLSSGEEVQIDVTIDGTSLTGTWKAVEPGTATPTATGTLTGTRT
jgi:hypothetical protein